MELIIENIRSFSGRHAIPIKPLTLLTGENSSGKSTLLAALSIISDPYGSPLHPRFNEPPYALGNYESIATFDEGNSTYAPSFALGYKQSENQGIESITTYINNQGWVRISSIAAKNNKSEGELKFLWKPTEMDVDIRVMSEGNVYGPVLIPFGPEGQSDRSVNFSIFIAVTLLAHTIGSLNSTGKNLDMPIQEVSSLFSQRQQNALSIAPIRTKPRRTYDEVTQEFAPEGGHIPFVLANVLDNPVLRTTIERFGSESGLYTKLDVKKLGEQLSDPTQVMVTSSNRAINLINVGYGVSQILPVVVESILAKPQTLLLVQQPEVHLHPRAQAALGSFFVDLTANGSKQFVVETHSDYIIDRVRTEVARGIIPAEDVGILYLEKHGFETTVYSLELSDTGDILNAPPSYRAFFLEEELNLFNRAER